LHGGYAGALLALLLASVTCLVASAAKPPAKVAAEEEVATTREALQEWVDTRRTISKTRRDWALSREMLQERIEIVQHEIESLRSKIAEAEESIAEAEKKRTGLVEENEKLRAASAALDDTIIVLEGRTRELLVRLPDPLRERVRPLSQRFPEDPEETELFLGERFQNVVGILNEVNKFNREIGLTSELRTLPDGTSVEVTTLYVGAGQAYYVSATGTVAGVGRATAQGWTWIPANDAAPQIAQAIAILKNEQVASFVRLPIAIK
jgi:FtsZ-binding cell division protein ZapB